MMTRPEARAVPRLVALAMVAVSTLTSHASASPSEEVVAQEMPIVNGTAVEPGGGLGTVALVRTDGDARLFCSAVLIAPTVALTAAHCLMSMREQTEGVDCRSDCDQVPEEPCRGAPRTSVESLLLAAGFTGPDDLANAEFVPVRQFSTHPRYNALNQCNDIAILGLEVPVTAVDPVPVLPAEMLSDIEIGNLALAQGYGWQLDPGSSELLPQERYVQRLNETRNEIVYIDETTFATDGGRDSSSVCFGDSGGPLYVEEDGGDYVIGIAFSLHGTMCGDGGLYTLAPAYVDWIARGALEIAEYGDSARNGGGCSAVPGGKPLSPLALFALFLLLMGTRRLRGTRRGLLALCLVPLALCVGCADDEAPYVSDESFCTGERDPLGSPLCDDGVERMSVFQADALVRESSGFGDEVWLWNVTTGWHDGTEASGAEVLDAHGEAAY